MPLLQQIIFSSSLPSRLGPCRDEPAFKVPLPVVRNSCRRSGAVRRPLEAALFMSSQKPGCPTLPQGVQSRLEHGRHTTAWACRPETSPRGCDGEIEFARQSLTRDSEASRSFSCTSCTPRRQIAMNGLYFLDFAIEFLHCWR